MAAQPVAHHAQRRDQIQPCADEGQRLQPGGAGSEQQRAGHGKFEIGGETCGDPWIGACGSRRQQHLQRTQ